MVIFKSIHRLTCILLLLLLVDFHMSGWVCQWKRFWIFCGKSFQKAYWEEWIFTGDDSSNEQGFLNFPALVQSSALPAPRPARQPDALPRKPIGSQDAEYFEERTEARLPPLRPRCNLIHPWQITPFFNA